MLFGRDVDIRLELKLKVLFILIVIVLVEVLWFKYFKFIFSCNSC